MEIRIAVLRTLGVLAFYGLVCAAGTSPMHGQGTPPPKTLSPQQAPAAPPATVPAVNQSSSGTPAANQSGSGNQTASGGASVPVAQKEIKETKETVQSKEIHDHPSDFVGVMGALAWPVSLALIVGAVLWAISRSDAL